MKDTFDKIRMDENRKEEMRDAIMHREPAGKKRIVTAASIAAVIALTMIIPFTRAMVINAAEKLITSFRTHNGDKVTISEDPDSIVYNLEPNNEAEEYARVKDGRLYFVLDGEWTDVTDICGRTDYYRHEVINDDGSREVIFVGGTPDSYGWWELLFDANDTYVWNQGRVPEGDEEWMRIACFHEGVYTGDPRYDELLDK